MVAVDDEGKPADLSVLEREDIAFDPTNQTMDLTKAQKLRTTALMLAIQAYDKLIIKDAELFEAVRRESGHNPALKIQPATMNAMVEAAIQFELFISGAFSQPLPAPAELTEQTSAEPQA